MHQDGMLNIIEDQSEGEALPPFLFPTTFKASLITMAVHPKAATDLLRVVSPA